VFVWAVPDLVVIPARGVPAVLDWKTGRASIDGAFAQLAVYGLFVEHALEVPFPSAGYEGQIADLTSGDVSSVVLDSEALRDAEDRIRVSQGRMRALAEEAGGDPFACPPPAERGRCRTCPFLELCAPELGIPAR
jgi:predicted RecB family nuclease